MGIASRGFIVPLLLIAIAVIIGGSTAYFFIQRPKLSQISASPTTVAVSTTTSNTAVLDETAGWKTYRNEHYKFEIKYPSTYEVYGQSAGIEHKPPIENDERIMLRTIENKFDDELYVDFSKNEKTPTEWDSIWSTTSKEISSPKISGDNWQFLGTTTFNGLVVGLRKFCYMGGCDDVMIIPKDNIIYQLSILSNEIYQAALRDNAESNKLRELIRSTFKFIN